MSCLFVDHLTVIDCALLDAARGLVGMSWIVDLELEGDLDAQSMVLDFGEVKRRIKRAIDDSLDHSLLVPLQSPQLLSWRDGGDTALHFRTAAGDLRHRSPRCAVTPLPAVNVDCASVTAALLPRLRAVVPDSVSRIGLTLREEVIDGAAYHYVHGLKKHAGHCQRIAHGHRSRIEIRIDGTRTADIEQAVARGWRDIYLGSREDLVDSRQGQCHFAYDAPEGHFALTLPASCCDILTTDTTVECLAEVLAQRVAAQHPGHRIEVRAYEGVMKGARARVE